MALKAGDGCQASGMQVQWYGSAVGSRLECFTHVVEESWAGCQCGCGSRSGTQVAAGGRKQGRTKVAGVSEYEYLWGKNSVKSVEESEMSMMTIDFFSDKSCWGHLQSKSLGASLYFFCAANPNSISKPTKEATKEKSITFCFYIYMLKF